MNKVETAFRRVGLATGRLLENIQNNNLNVSNEDERFLAIADIFLAWREAGRVCVTSTSTIQTLLAVTPTGEFTDEDMISPYGIHATIFDPPIRSKCQLNGCEDENHRVDFIVFGSHGSTLFDLYEKFCGIIGFADNVINVFYGTVEELNENFLSDPKRANVFRVAIGLSRLIKFAPPVGRGKKSIVDEVEVRDLGVSKKNKTRTIYVRNVFAVEPKLVEACKAYMRGERKAPSVRWITRGHWRNQAVGKMWSKRELRWIRPHWNGPVKGLVKPVEVRVK